jgi:hypothetical protein
MKETEMRLGGCTLLILSSRYQVCIHGDSRSARKTKADVAVRTAMVDSAAPIGHSIDMACNPEWGRARAG